MSWDWIKKEEERIEKERDKNYFDIKEGQQKFVLLTHFAPYAQVFEGGKYRPAVEGDTNVSIKGICWILQDGVIKLAKIPYIVTKEVHALSQNADWDFSFPFAHELTFSAKDAGTKEVKYSITPSPKKFDIPAAILEELKTKPTPEEMVEKLKAGKPAPKADYAEATISPEDIPF